MYLDAMEFLEEERDAWAPYEALAALSDEQLSTPVPAAHGWSGRDLMAHMLAWQGIALEAAQELAIRESSDRFARMDADWEARGGDVVNADLQAAWAARPLDELRALFASQPGELRGYLTVVPETRWLKHAENAKTFYEETTEHYEDHLADLRAILEAAGR
ncbi:MAG: maleylpyruvate isomerase N-terminal domain-containing protein [Candidatus Limnocylindria bacterium]